MRYIYTKLMMDVSPPITISVLDQNVLWLERTLKDLDDPEELTIVEDGMRGIRQVNYFLFGYCIN